MFRLWLGKSRVWGAQSFRCFALHFYINLNQDALNHDKGQKSAISGKFLRWIFEFQVDVFPFSPGFLCNLLNLGSRLPGTRPEFLDFPENR